VRTLGFAAAAAVMLSTGTALAEEASPQPSRGGQGWSTLSGQSVGNNATALTAQVGFPGLTLSFLRGMSSNLDFGGRFTFNYGYERLLTAIYPGVKGELLGRLQLLGLPRVNLGLQIGAGAFGYFAPGGAAVVGFSFPLALQVGIPIGSALVVSTGIDVPMYVTFGTIGGLTIPLLFGAGVEYFIDKSFVATFNTRMGPSINNSGFRYGSRAELALEAQVGIAYRLP
jgi:hypothetical protein